MFKRILKVVGIVLGVVAIGVGLIVAYLAATGEFKKKVVKPTSVHFAISDVEPEVLDEATGELIYPLVYDVNATDEEQIFSFVVGAEPADVTVRECTITISAQSSRLITFKHKVDGVWQDYKSNSFYLNQRVYFVVNEITEQNESDYIDGIVTFTVTDKSGLLQSKMNLSIDRQVSSVSVKDLSNDENNIVNGGKFKYETSASNNHVLHLGATVGVDYPLEIISAPLKALAPIKSKGEKTSEIYYMENNLPKLLVHVGEGIVKLQYNSDAGSVIQEDCDFLTYDESKSVFVLNSPNSNEYNFRVSTYKTYAQELELKSKEYSDRVADMISKDVRVSVTGNDANGVKFEGDDTSLFLNLFETTNFVVNNESFEDDGVQADNNLGLVLYKNVPYTEITDRYNEIMFIGKSHLVNGAEWNLNYYAGTDETNYNTMSLRFETANSKPVVRLLNSLQGLDKTIKADTMFDTKLVKVSNTQYELTLTSDEYTITFTDLRADGDFVIFSKNNTKMSIKRNSINADTVIKTDDGKVYKLDGDAFTQVNKVDAVWLPNVYYTNSYSLILTEAEFNENSTINKLQDSAMEAVDKSITTKYVANAYYTKDAQGNYALLNSPEDFNTNNTYYKLKDGIFTETDSFVDNANYVLTNIGDAAHPQYVYELWTTNNYNFATQFNFGDRLVETTTETKDDEIVCQYQAIKKGIYLVFLDDNTDENLNDNFSINVEYNSINPNNSIISITPINPTLINNSIKLYALVINSDGSYYYTDELQNALIVSVLKSTPQVLVPSENRELELEADVSSGNTNISYTNINVEDLVKVTNASNVELDEYGVVMLAPKVRYELLTWENQPDNWGEIYTNYYRKEYIVPDSEDFVVGKYFKVKDGGGYEIATLEDWSNVTCYKLQFTKLEEGTNHTYKSETYYYNVNNNYSFIDGVSYWHEGIEYVLLGSGDINGDFVNQIVPTGMSYNSKLYPVVPSVQYLVDKHRVQTPTEYINMLLDNGKVLSIENRFELNNPIRIINANSYYVFGNTAVNITFGGDYFDTTYSQINTTANGQMIISKHNEISATIEGKKINSLTAQVVFNLNNSNNAVINQVLSDIVDELDIKVHRYNASGVWVQEYAQGNAPISVNKDDIELVYDVGQYNKDITYYNDKYEKVDSVPQEVIDDWENKRENYYIRSSSNKLSVSFTATSTIDAGESVRLVFVYKGQEFASNRLYIGSRDVTGYSLKSPNPINYIAKITEDITASYKPNTTELKTYYTLVDNIFTDGNLKLGDDLSTKVYYELTEVSGDYTGEIRYLITVGYGVGYTYNVTIVDDNGNYLVTKEEVVDPAITTLKLITTTLNNAFTVGKGIDFAPFYASNHMSYVFDNDSYIKFEKSEVSKTYPDKISVASITNNEFKNIVLRSSDNININLTIKAKIIADEKFKFGDTNEFKYESNETTTSLTDFSYKYDTTDLTADLIPTLISVKEGVVEAEWLPDPNNTDVANKKWTYKKVNSEKTITISYSGSKWNVERSDYSEYIIVVKFTGVSESQGVTIKFNKPYSYTKSATNATTTVYAGTSFVLADIITDNDTNNTNTLYHSMTDKLSIYYINIDNIQGDQIEADSGLVIWNIDGKITASIKQKFGIYYENVQIDTFTLTILPNAFVLGDTDTIYELDDENNTTHTINIDVKKYNENITYYEYTRYQETNNFDSDTTYKYSNGEYMLASSADDKGTDGKLYSDSWVDVTPTYECQAYTDAGCNNSYNVDIVTINDTTITVNSPISEIGTYYVKVNIMSDIAKIGELKYKVTAKTDIVVEDIEIEAKSSNELSAESLISKAEINNQYYIKETNPTWAANTYYYLDKGEYKLFASDEAFNEYEGDKFTKVDLSNAIRDIFWINSPDEALTITYKYDTCSYTQGWDWNGTQFVPYINYEIGGSKVKFVFNSESHNVYEFKNDINTILLKLSVDNGGKKLEIITNVSSSETYNLTTTGLSGITLTYSSFGSNLKQDAQYIKQIASSAEVVISLDGTNYHNIKSSRPFNINITPYIVELSEADKQLTIDASGIEQLLYDGATDTTDRGLFKNAKEDENIASISIQGVDVSVINNNGRYSVNLQPQGNVAYAKIKVTLTYSDATTYTYTETLTIINDLKVQIEYPYNVTNTQSEYELFNTNINNIVRDTNNNVYDTTDLKVWLNGVLDASKLTDTSIDTMKFDLAIKGDSINLIKDDTLGITRFNVYEETIKLDDISSVGKIELEAVSSGLSGYLTNLQNGSWLSIQGSTINITNNFTASGYMLFKVYTTDLTTSPYGYYLIKVVNDTNFSGVQNTRGVGEIALTKIDNGGNPPENETKGILQLIKDSSIQISTVGGVSPSHVIDNNLYFFMIYNYDNSQNPLNFGTETEPKYINRGDLVDHDQFLPFGINTGFIKIAVVLKIGDSLAWIGNYRFTLASTIEVDTDVNADDNKDNDFVNPTPENTDEHIYVAKSISYDFATTTNNTKGLSSYLTVTENGDPKSLSSEEGKTPIFATDRYLTNGFIFNSDKNSIYYDQDKDCEYDDDGTDIEVAKIDGNNLVLVKATSDDYEFYIKLTYDNGFVAYLHFSVEKYSMPETSLFNIGRFDESEKEFVTSIDLKDLVGENYAEGYDTATDLTLSYNGVSPTFSDKKFEFAQTTTSSSSEITIDVNNVVPTVTKTVTVNIQPSIDPSFSGNTGKTSDNPIVTTKAESGTINAIGSSLKVDINRTLITIKSNDVESPYYTINAKNITSVNFDLYAIDDTTNSTRLNNYFTDNFEATYDIYMALDAQGKENYRKTTAKSLSGTSNLYFAHTATDKVFKLVITVKTSSDEYASQTIYIKLEATYTLSSNYRVEDAEYEVALENDVLQIYGGGIEDSLFGYGKATYTQLKSVASVPSFTDNPYYKLENGKYILLTAQPEKWDSNYTNYYTCTTASVGLNNVNDTRFVVKIGVREFKSVTDLINLGLFEDGNPNKLVFNVGEGTASEILNPYDGSIKFGSSESGNADAVLNLTNSTGTAINYNFKVQSEAVNFNNVTLNPNLLYTESGSNSYLSITMSQIDNNSLVLATLPYSIINDEDNDNTTNQPAYILTTDDLVLEIVSDNNQIVLRKVSGGVNKDLDTGSYQIKIITINGVAKQFNLVISNFAVTHPGYKGENSETLYAGRSYYIDNSRIEVTDGSDITLSSDTLKYCGALNGVYNEYYGSSYDYDNGDLIIWNSTDLSFEIKAVSQDTTITLVFNVLNDDNVIGRVCYVLNIKNHIEISLNGTSDSDNSVDIYLASPMYNRETGKFTIDLMDKGDSDNYNNVYAILKHYLGFNSEGSPISSTIFDGTSKTNVGQHLRFEIEDYGAFENSGNLSVDQSTGVITINKNIDGVIRLRITSVGATNYSETFTVNVHKYENVDITYTSTTPSLSSSSIGWLSGSGIDLYSTDHNEYSGKFAFVISETICDSAVADSNKERDYTKTIINDNFKYAILDEGETIGTNTGWKDVTGISAGKWNLPQVPYDNTARIVVIRLEINILGGSESNYYYAYYKVRNDVQMVVNDLYSVNGKDKVLTYGDDAWKLSGSIDQLILMNYNNTGLYSAVTVINQANDFDASAYNLAYVFRNVTSNDFVKGKHYIYSNGNFVLASAWSSGTTYYTKHYVGIKSENDYYEPIKSSDGFDSGATYYSWNGNIYEASAGATTSQLDKPDDFYYPGLYFKKIESEPTFQSGVYYKTSSIMDKLVSNGTTLDSTTMHVELVNAEEESRKVVVSGITNGTLTLSLPTGVKLFDNEADILIRFIGVNNQILFEDEWHFRSSSVIEAKSSRPLTDFFLTSEIPNDLLGESIIGVMSTYVDTNASNFVNLGSAQGSMFGYWKVENNKYTYVDQDSVQLGDTASWILYKVTYTYGEGNNIHNTTKDYYVLAGSEYAMNVTFNAGEYINIVVEDNIVKNTLTAYLKDYITMFTMDNGKFDEYDLSMYDTIKPSSIIDNSLPNDAKGKIKPSDSNITLNNVAELSTYSSLRVIVAIQCTIGGNIITRYIPVEFNFIISANNGKSNTTEDDVYDTTNGEFNFNQAVADSEGSTFDFSDTTSQVKLDLLSWIKYSGANITANDYNKFKVEVKNSVTTGKYDITYTYNYNNITYTRTFVMSANPTA